MLLPSIFDGLSEKACDVVSSLDEGMLCPGSLTSIASSLEWKRKVRSLLFYKNVPA